MANWTTIPKAIEGISQNGWGTGVWGAMIWGGESSGAWVQLSKPTDTWTTIEKAV